MIRVSRLSPWVLLPAVLAAIGVLESSPAFSQNIAECRFGQDCCVVGRTNSRPYRYALACDSNSASAGIAAASGGYVQLIFGPMSYVVTAGWMANARIPGWEGSVLPGYRYPDPPPPDQACFLGQTCCAVGRKPTDGPFAWAYDGAAQRSDMALTQTGHAIVLSQVSREYCHYWWNANVAAAGLGQWIADATPSGAIPFSDAATGQRTQTPPSATGALSLAPGSWRQLPNFVGRVQQGNQGLVLGGGAWTNGRVVNGRQDGNGVESVQTFDFSGGGDIYMRYSVAAGGKYLGIYPGLFSGVSVRHLSTLNSWAGSVVIPEQTWIYAHLRLSADGGHNLAIALGDYDDRGGQVIDTAMGNASSLTGTVQMRFVDNYAGTDASVVIGEVIVRTGR